MAPKDEIRRMLELSSLGKDGPAMGNAQRVYEGQDVDETQPDAKPRHTRLSVNLGAGAAHALRELMARRGINATEAIRRAISVWKFVEDERARGHRFAVIEGDGKGQVREVVFHLD